VKYKPLGIAIAKVGPEAVVKIIVNNQQKRKNEQ
jgi:hypothetical protein